MQLTMKEKNNLFENLVSNYQGLIYSIIYGITLDGQESWDLTQDVFIKAFENELLFSDGYKVKAWLATVARNTALKNQRSLKRKLSYLLRYCGIGIDHSAQQLEEQLINEEEIARLNNTLEDLSIDERELVTLRFSAELSYKEIAEIMQIKIGTVMSRLSRLKEKLGSAFAEEI
jgi:RNA polymerase sigma-70 factor (ECF subfamily)